MKRHRLDVFALCAGGFFLALAVGFLFDGLDAWDMNVNWIGPVLLIALGLAGVLSTLGRASRPEPRPELRTELRPELGPELPFAPPPEPRLEAPDETEVTP